MENEITAKRGLILILVIATVSVFIGLVWLISTYLPLNLLGNSSPSYTPITPLVAKNCTYPVSYWMEHPELYPPRMVLGSKVLRLNEIRKALTGADQNPTAKLQAQLVGAFLNISSGADQGLIETTIFQAYSWLVQHPDGSQVSESDLETISRYYSLLEAYNLGLAGVAPCLEGSTPAMTETSTPSVTPTLLLTFTPSQTLTLTPSETPTPIEVTVTATYIFILPTNTVIWNTQPPIQLPSTTPIRPTEPPPPTNIPPPPDTPIPTQSPPTSTLPPPTPTLPQPSPTLP
jgi:hypothetical protein